MLTSIAAGSDSKGEKDVPLACMNVPNFANDMLFSNEDILQILSPLMQEKSVVSEEFHLQQIEHLQETMREKFEDFEGKHRETLYELQEMKQLLAQLVRRK